jgi:hypothetical protein
MAHQKELPPNKGSYDNITREVIQRVWLYCLDNNLTSGDVVQTLLTAAGAYGWTLPDKSILLREINKFLKTTRMIYPEFIIENPSEYGQYLSYLREIALEQKRWQTVH